MRRAVVLFAVTVWAYSAGATIIHVPAEESTIQDGIVAAGTGDTVLVADGHYYERISFLGKMIVVASEYIIGDDSSHILNTIIDADPAVLGAADTGSVVRFVNGEVAGSRLQGFTITGGVGTRSAVGGRAGGGIFLHSSVGEVRNCIVSGNSADYGGGFHGQYSGSIYLEDCEINDNEAFVGGGGLGTYVDGRLYLSRCAILGNTGPTGPRPSDGVWGNIHPIVIMGNSVISTEQHMNYDGYDGSIITLDACELWSVKINDLSFGDITIDNSMLYACSAQYVYSDLFMTNDSLFDSYVGVLDMMTNGCVVRDCAFVNSGIRNFNAIANVEDSYIGDGIHDIGTEYNQIIVRNSTVHGGISSARSAWATLIENTVVTGDIELVAPWEPITITNSTVADGHVRIESYAETNWLGVFNSIIATDGDPALIIDGGPYANVMIEIECCDFYGFYTSFLGGDATPSLVVSYLYFDDPMFCDPGADDYQVSEGSRCAPANNDCLSLIGARDVGCCCVNRGDIDHNGAVLPMDVVYFVNWLWNGGPEPPCLEEVDANGDGNPAPMDAVYLVNYFWNSGPPPVPCF